jgi:hypothetical protein
MIVDKKCCTNCFSESAIIDFIKSDDIIGDCDYCGSTNIHICDVVDVGHFIMEGVERYYEDAANSVAFESAEGGYQFPSPHYYLNEILLDQEDIFGETLGDPDLLMKDLVSIDGTDYVRRDPYGPPTGHPEEIWYWKKFCKIVKTKQRYTTFLSSKDENEHDYSQPKNFMFHLAHHFMPELIDILPAGTKIYRARINNDNKQFSHEKLTSPPLQDSRNNRMSPAGISFFYGGLSPDVCIHELRPTISENITVAEFDIIKNLFILNFTKTFEAHRCIFDPEYSFAYDVYSIPFLEHFADDISKPIRNTDNEIEYIPTQIFTEFIKTINFKSYYPFPDANNNESDVYLDGILFKSSIMKDGVNLVLFRGPDISIDCENNTKDAWLLYKGNKTYRTTEINISSMIIKYPQTTNEDEDL